MSTRIERELVQLHENFPAALDYLTTIFLIDRDYGTVGNARLAQRLGVSKPAVTQAVARLKRHRLVDQDLYGAIRLTREGRVYAARILRRHYLIEHLLIHRLAYPWDLADEEARRLQTAVSEKFSDYLYALFERPDICPHGNPFPGSRRERTLIDAPRLTKAPVGIPIDLLRITEEGETIDGLLRFCHRHNLHPGARLHVRSIVEGGGIEADIGGRGALIIPPAFAAFLCYAPAG